MRYEELLDAVRRAYPQLKFRPSTRFKFRPPATVYYESEPALLLSTEQKYCLQLLHEIGHALLGHRDYRVDLERVQMECAAWAKAQELCEHYHIYYDVEFAETELDTYRDWLHQRSLCKNCGLTCYQTPDGIYHCPHCEAFSLEKA